MSRNLSDVVGHLFPTTQVGSYPRPSWNSFDVRDRDFRVAMRDAQFAEAYADGVRAMIGDQIDAGIDVPTDATSGTTATRDSSRRSCCIRPTTWTASPWSPRSTR